MNNNKTVITINIILVLFAWYILAINVQAKEYPEKLELYNVENVDDDDNCHGNSQIRSITREKIFVNGNYEESSSGIGEIYEYDINGNETKHINCYIYGDLIKPYMGYYIYEYNSLGDRTKCIYVEEDGSISLHIEYEYDENNNMIKEIKYGNMNPRINPYGSVSYYIVYEYEDNGKIINKKEFNQDGILLDNSVFEYDYNGNEVRNSFYNADGELYKCNEYEYEYDRNNNEIKIMEYQNGNLINYSLFEYDSNSNKIKEINYNPNGDINYEYDYNNNGNMIKEIRNGSNYRGNYCDINEYEYDSDGNIIKGIYYDNGTITNIVENEYYNNKKLKKQMCYTSDGVLSSVLEYDNTGKELRHTMYNLDGSLYRCEYWVEKYEYYDEVSSVPIQTSGIYCASTSPSIVAGMVIDNKAEISKDIEYQWLVYDEAKGTWAVASDWTLNNEYMNYTPAVSGNYIFVCNARIVGDPDSEESASFGTPFTKTGGIKQICQMPYEGGGYLIGFESYENPNQDYQYEMFVMDLSLLAAGSPTPWVHATGKIKLAQGATPEDGKTMWTIWQPQYGYYLTLFRLYDKDGNMIDEVPYGFANAY